MTEVMSHGPGFGIGPGVPGTLEPPFIEPQDDSVAIDAPPTPDPRAIERIREAEQAVLGAVFLDMTVVEHAGVFQLLVLDDFADPRNRAIWRAMQALRSVGSVIDPITLGEELKRVGHLAEAGNMEYVAYLLDAVPTAANVAFHADLVRDAALERRLLRVAQAIPRHVARAKQRGLALASEIEHLVHTVANGTNPTSSPTRLRWYTEDELHGLPAPTDLIGGYVPGEALVEVYGPSGHLKTILALDFSASVASGHPWHGTTVRQGPVAYIAAEGRRGLCDRLRAWRHARDWGGSLDIRFLLEPVRFLDAAMATQLLTDIERWNPPPRLVVVDTFAWCLAPDGHENDTRDVQTYVSVCGRIRDRVGATVLTVHHAGLDGTRERGNTALRAGQDAVIATKLDGERLTVTCEKARDSALFEPLVFRKVETDRSVALEMVVAATGKNGLSPAEQKVLRALCEIFVGDPVSTSQWREAAEVGHGTFYRARKRLLEAGDVPPVRREGKGYVPTDYQSEVPGTNEVPF